jgi:beta-carotene 3-hydroxylase
VVSFVLLAFTAMVVMEPVTALVHRFVMHGIGERLHRSHHRARTGTFEANDWYPVCFAALVMIGFALGFNVVVLAPLVPIGVGVTAYGALYAIVHDGYIHRRLPWVRAWPERHPNRLLDHLAAAHRIHHRRGAAPYGMLVPIVPKATPVRQSARTRPADRTAVPGPV